MYSFYGAATALAAHTLRSKPPFCPSYGALFTDPPLDCGAGEVSVNGLSINTRFLLYDYYLRQSRLIYWSPARTFLACRPPCHTQYFRLALRGQGCLDLSCSSRRHAREEKCSSCCCCCQCRSSGGHFGEEVVELLADGGGHCRGGFEVHCSGFRGGYCNGYYDRFERPKKSWRKEVEIRDANRKKERPLRGRRNGSRWTCRSCGSRGRESRGRRDSEEVENFEEEDYDDGSSDISTEMVYRRRGDNVKASSSRRRVSQREGRGKDCGNTSSSHRLQEDYDSGEEDIIQHRKRREESQRIADICEDDMKKTSRSGIVVSSRMDREKGSTSSVKQQRKVDRRAVGRDEWDADKREAIGASSRVSDHDAREEYDYKRHNAVARRGTKEGSEKLVKLLDVYEDDRTFSSSNKIDERKMEREDNSMLAAKWHNRVDQEVIRRPDLKTHHREEHVSDEERLLRQRESRNESHKSTRISEVHENDVTRISRTNNIIDSRKVNREETSTSTFKQHSELDERARRSSQSRSSIQKHSDILEVDNQKLESITNTKIHYDVSELNNREDNYASVKVAKDDRTHVNEQVVDTLELDNKYGSQARVSGVNVSGNEIASGSQSRLETRLDDRKDYSTSIFSRTHESVVQENVTKKSTRESSSTRESKRHTSSELSSLDTKRISNIQATNSTMVKDEIGDYKFLTGEYVINTRTFDYLRSDTQNDLDIEVISNRQRETLKGSSSSIKTGKKDMQKNPNEEGSQMTASELILIGTSDDQTSSGNATIKGDMLDYAAHLERASTTFIGEFVDKVEREMSSSKILENQGEEKHDGSSDASAIMTSGYDVTEHSLEEDARRSSSQSKTEGPSDEIWDVRSPNSQETSQMEPSEEETSSQIVESKASTPATESITTHRSPRSLWAFLADIIRVGRWGNRPESRALTRKSGKRSSSTDSAGSEAWYSGQEQDASEDETDKPSKSTSKVPLLVKEPVDKTHNRSSSSLGQTSSVMPKVEGKIIKAEGTTVSDSMGMLLGGSTPTGAPSTGMIQGGSQYTGTPSMGMIQGGSAPIAASTAFRREGNIRIDTGAGSMLSSVMPPGNSPVISGASLVTAQEAIVVEDISISANDFKKMEEDIITEGSPEAENFEGKEGESKRKFQRNQQVLKERFDEWEEAFRVEEKQRQIDEHFMREALAEAQKAADTWEVPVGAVLVQDGKIIARGFNLVEELRDSTAHAEMICIREASNLLKTWRLAGTKLYVTLEPCPMCAGAILQARIDVVVWGAPNKLLGADGSWVRLFPGGDGGSSSMGLSDQSVGPIHPFHPKITIRRGILAAECSEVMQQFFKLRRKKEKKRESTPPSCLPVPTYPIKFFTKMHNAFSVMFCLY